MAAVPITIVGIETRSDGTSDNVAIVGMASLTGLGVGGGPVIPPPGIWPGPGPLPHPEHPIVLPPVDPGGPPVEIWPRPGHPAHPIVLPPPPGGTTPSPPGVSVKPPPADGGWAYVSNWGWGYFPMGTSAGPKT